MTINQFVDYCKVYPYSMESYEIKKETMEIDLMDSYLEAMKFSNKMSTNPTVTFEDGWLVESSDFDIILLEESVKTRKKSLLTRIIDGILSLCKRFAAMVGRLIGVEKDSRSTVETWWDRIRHPSIHDPASILINLVGASVMSQLVGKAAIKIIPYADRYWIPEAKLFADKLNDSAKERFSILTSLFPNIFMNDIDEVVVGMDRPCIGVKDLYTIEHELRRIQVKGSKIDNKVVADVDKKITTILDTTHIGKTDGLKADGTAKYKWLCRVPANQQTAERVRRTFEDIIKDVSEMRDNVMDLVYDGNQNPKGETQAAYKFCTVTMPRLQKALTGTIIAYDHVVKAQSACASGANKSGDETKTDTDNGSEK